MAVATMAVLEVVQTLVEVEILAEAEAEILAVVVATIVVREEASKTRTTAARADASYASALAAVVLVWHVASVYCSERGISMRRPLRRRAISVTARPSML